MKAEQALMLLEGRKVLRHKQQVFFISRDEEEAEHFGEKGCLLIPFQPQAWSRPQLLHYEVHVHPLLDSVVVEDIFGGKRVDYVERDRLLKMLGDRDGYAFPFQDESRLSSRKDQKLRLVE